MKNVIGSLVAVAGLAVVANAQTPPASVLNLQVSLDGTNWSDNVDVRASVGTQTPVLMRALIRWETNDATALPIGFASLTWQPTYGNVRFGRDIISPYADRGNNTNGGSVVLDNSSDDMDGPFGRVSPFGATGPSGNTTTPAGTYATMSHTNPPGMPAGNYYRIARGDINLWMGQGPTSGTGAANNFNGAAGVACVQKANPGPGDPAELPGLGTGADAENPLLVLWQIRMLVDGVGQGETHVIDVIAPTAGMSRDATTGNRQASWFRDAADNAGATKASVRVDPASITITPAPGALALLGLGGLIAGRRRRA